jgi:hypothetical protein
MNKKQVEQRKEILKEINRIERGHKIFKQINEIKDRIKATDAISFNELDNYKIKFDFEEYGYELNLPVSEVLYRCIGQLILAEYNVQLRKLEKQLEEL